MAEAGFRVKGVQRLTTLVLVGGGHAHALVLKAWVAGGSPPARVVLVSPEAHAAYSAMLPGHVAGHYRWADMHVDLARLAERAGVARIADRAVAMDLAAGRLHLEHEPPLAFDVLSLDTGSTSGVDGLEGAVPVKPLTPFLERWAAFLGAGTGDAAVLGGGLGGVELALAMAHRLGRARRVTLVERASRPVPGLSARIGARLQALLEAGGVTVRCGAAAVAVLPGSVELDNGETVAASLTVAAAGARPAPWIAKSGLAVAPAGFVRVDPHLRSVSHGNVFAAGDVAHIDHAPREKAGVFAVRQAPVLAGVLTAAAAGGTLASYRPQTDYLRLVALGEQRALAIRHGLAVGGNGLVGAVLWRLKDRMERRVVASHGAGWEA